jgi:hypothetical protein
MQALLDFFDTVKGKWDTFTFTDPYDGTLENVPARSGRDRRSAAS